MTLTSWFTRVALLAALGFTFSAPFASGQQGRLKDVKIRGYVTDVRSPTDFDIEDYRIRRDETFALDFENAGPDIKFNLSDVRVGVELEIRGQLDESTGELKAKSIRVDLEQFRSIKQTAIVSRQLEGIQLVDGSWAGEFVADGQIIRVGRDTKVTFKLTAREKKLAKKAKAHTSDPEDQFEPLESVEQVTVGMTMTYEGRRDRDTGRILAERVEFTHNDLENGEAKLWSSLKTTVKPAQGFRPGELKVDRVGKFKLPPAPEVQEYVSSLGNSLTRLPAGHAKPMIRRVSPSSSMSCSTTTPTRSRLQTVLSW